MLKRIELFQGRSIDLVYDEKVYDPTHTSIDVIFVADMFLPERGRVLDVGTGSGVIALALKRLNPKADVHATDVDDDAVKTAQSNARGLKLKVEVFKGDLAEGRTDFDMVVANLPTYNDKDIETYPQYGPKVAYYSDKEDGLRLYKKLFEQLPVVLKPEGLFVCECRQDLQEAMIKYADQHDWEVVMQTDNSLAFFRKQ